jgi:lipocalin
VNRAADSDPAPAPAPAAAADDAPADAPATRGNRSARISDPIDELNDSAPVADARPAAATAAAPQAAAQAEQAVEQAEVPEALPSVPTAPAAPAAAVDVAAPAPAEAQIVPTVAVVASIPAAPTAYAAPAPDPAPAAALIDAVLASFGWQPAGGAVVAAPALAAFTGQRSSAEPAAVIGTPVAAASGPNPQPKLPGQPTNGVTGVQVGHSQLEMPGAFIGDSVAADWYFPTQVDGSVDAQGVIWLQHGFGATNTFYSALAKDLAQRTNSIVVAPTLSSIPFTFSGGCLVCDTSQQAAAEILLANGRPKLVESAVAAGYTGDLTEIAAGKFALAGHSAGGGFATATAADFITGGDKDRDLVGVVMYDGVSNGTGNGEFAQQIAVLDGSDTPVYQIAAPAQSWNAFGATTNALVNARTGEFVGVVLNDGSHVDSMLGVNPFIDLVLQVVTKFVPAGNTAATYTLSTGWLNDMYAGLTPQDAEYGFYAGANTPILMGPTAAVGLPAPLANQISGFTKIISEVAGLFGIHIPDNIPTSTDNGVDGLVVPTNGSLANGVTGVRVGTANLVIPSGTGYNAPADWYFPTQADGTVAPNGVIWLQHGFLGFKDWYADLAIRMAQETNSIVVAPSIFWFDDAYTGEAAAQMFLGDRAALNISANKAGLQGTLPEKFLLTGHSAGGRFATTAGAFTVDNGAAKDLLGVVMFDGVSSDQFAAQLAKLDSLNIPDYQIAAPPQRWNAWGVTTEQLAALKPGEFVGIQIDAGSHTDSIGGDSFFGWLGSIGSDIFVKPSPPGGKEAVGTFATGWINDIYGGFDPTSPVYGIYGNPNSGTYVENQSIVMGEAGATTLPAPPPVDVEQYRGTWYEQGSVKQFFAIGLVNTKAVYTPQTDGTIKVENSGNYFGPNGPESNITGAAVAVNSPTNTRLNVGFGFGDPNNREPGNYWIIDYAPDYSWAIVSDPSYRSGYILTREKFISEAEYNKLLARATQLGITGRITPTEQFPDSSSAAAQGPAAIPATVTV